MAERIEYRPDEWEPGLPIFKRPGAFYQGNHVRPIFQLIPDVTFISTVASWPEPEPAHCIDGDPS